MGVYVTAHEHNNGVYKWAPYPQFGDIKLVSIYNDPDETHPTPSFKLTKAYKSLIQKFTSFPADLDTPLVLTNEEVTRLNEQLHLVDPGKVQAECGISPAHFQDIVDFTSICAKHSYTISIS